MKKINKMFQQAPLSKFVQSSLSLAAFTILGFTAIKPVNAASLHTGFASYTITDVAFPIKLESNRDIFSFKMRGIDGAEAVPEPSEIAGIVTSAAFLVGVLLKRKSKSLG
ncbi:PEP-CTERM sorting domain-containing protein [Microcoleus sp. CAWBG640]|uniref:PEP-CTERM sorting domain-containing protein n=1 Tax=Microcoleus sp. CAWBG640 TaxID=2841653 RepID=UPI00312B363D